MQVIVISIINAFLFAIHCIFVCFFLLHKHKASRKSCINSVLIFLAMYYVTIYFLDSIYAIFFSGICTFILIRMIFKESLFMSLFISLVTHTFKIIIKSTLLYIINDSSLVLVNTYKTLCWNALLVNFISLVISTLIFFIFRKHLKRCINYILSLKNRKIVLIVAIYLNLILILLNQSWEVLFSLDTLTDFLMIFTVIYVGLFNVTSEMKMNSLNNFYFEMFECSKASGELLNNYKMQVHENKNKLLMIKSMLSGPKKNVEKYINELLDEINSNKSLDNYWLSELRFIPLPGIRNFINYKLNKLTRLNASIEVFVSSELENIDATTISDTEYNQLTTILGVILDNMTDSIAESDDKLISINIYIQDNVIHGEFVNSYKGTIDLSRLFEIGYSTKGEKHGVGLPLVKKILKSNKRFDCKPAIVDNFFVQHLTIKLYSDKNLQKTQK